jgi:hypothetical protein
MSFGETSQSDFSTAFEQLPQLLALAERIADALIELGEGRQGARSGALWRERRNEEKVLVRVRARQRDPDLRLDPVHHAFRADINDKGGRARDRLFDLRLPLPAGPEVVLVEPNLEACRAPVGVFEQPALQVPRGVAVRAGVAEKDEGRGLIHAREPRHLSEARPRLAIAEVPLAVLSRTRGCAIDPPRDVFAS